MAAGGKLQSFERALHRASKEGKRPHLLLGNGFSRACRDDIFAYGALFDRADFQKCSPKAQQAFEALNTSDFEVVMRALRDTATLLKLYGGETHAKLRAQLLADAAALREVLVHAIADSHPSRPGDISPESYARCRAFLERFADVYTLNYDLLLYWAIMQEELQPEVSFDDGFRTPEDGPSEYVTWEVEKTDQQSVFYLHGALHIFDAGHEIKKYTWVNTGIRLIDQIRSALEHNFYPLFVAEGESDRKLARIKHSDFLARSYRSFAKIAGTLVVFGHSFADNDAHILQRISRGRIAHLLVGIHGNADSPINKRLIKEAKALASGRPQKRPLLVDFFDSTSVEVW